MKEIDPERTCAEFIVDSVNHHDVRKAHFVKGPIPYPWITESAKLPGKALAVAVALQYAKGLKRSGTIHLTPTLYRDFGLTRHSLYRGLRQLGDRGLIGIQSKRGRSPIVTILDASRTWPRATRPRTGEQIDLNPTGYRHDP